MIANFGTFEYALADRYRFELELGRGATAIVYRARDLRLGRPVAIKILHGSYTNEVGSRRFQSEIRIAAGLHHPGIIGIHDCGEADGRLFYVMEYLGGETLRARLLRERELSVRDALLVTRQVADALQHAHDRAIIHRDVKPENIILADGRACLTDFGLARAINDAASERLTASGMTVGTPEYLSPEQAAAERTVGEPADQYALACVLYEMLAGTPPFSGPTATAIALRHVRDVPPSLRLRRPDLPHAVDNAVSRALRKVPQDRYESVREFKEAFDAMRQDVESEPPTGPRPTSFPSLSILLRKLAGRRSWSNPS